MEVETPGFIKDLLSTTRASRRPHMAEKVLIVDGQWGCGKTMLSPIVTAFDRVELLTYAYELEYICALKHLQRITDDAALVMARMLTDQQIYNTMMSRETNFRPTDMSSVFRDANPWRYFKRLFEKGDEEIPGKIKREKPILHLTTHNLLTISEPVFAGLKERLVFVEVVRHPLYMVKQQMLNMDRLISDVRDLTVYFDFEGQDVPFYAHGWEKKFLQANSAEKVIYLIEHFTTFNEKLKPILREKYQAKILTIPFEDFVLSPDGYLQELEKLLETKMSSCMPRVLRKQRVPRKKIAAGIDLKIYRRCGWQPPLAADSSEEEELAMRRKFVAEKASPAAMQVLDKICHQYEEKYFKH